MVIVLTKNGVASREALIVPDQYIIPRSVLELRRGDALAYGAYWRDLSYFVSGGRT